MVHSQYLLKQAREKILMVNTQGLIEDIWCAMCTNTFEGNNNCDDKCIVDEDMYKKIMNAIRHHSIKIKSKEKETTDNYVSRKEVEYIITSGKYLNESYEQFIDRLVKELKNLPPVTSTHKVGKWKQEYLGCMYDVCSECGQKVTSGHFKYNYCPNCGIKMEGGNEE